MGLEAATYIDGLTSSWPLAGDNKSVGDDHLRLIKSVLKATFPAATKPFRFPTAEAISGALVLDATDQNNNVIVTTSGGNVAVTLPSTLTTTDKGWSCQITKTSLDANAAIVSPASGTIASRSGSTATIRVGIICEPATFFWTGTAWLCSKPGVNIGATENFDGDYVPHGYLEATGAAFSSTDFAELFAVLASSTLRDKRGRTEIGVGTGTGLTNRVLGTHYGAETHALSVAELATHSHVNTLSDPGHSHVIPSLGAGGSLGGNTVAGVFNTFSGNYNTSAAATGITISNANAGSGTAHANMQPSIGTKKIIRAC